MWEIDFNFDLNTEITTKDCCFLLPVPPANEYQKLISIDTDGINVKQLISDDLSGQQALVAQTEGGAKDFQLRYVFHDKGGSFNQAFYSCDSKEKWAEGLGYNLANLFSHLNIKSTCQVSQKELLDLVIKFIAGKFEYSNQPSKGEPVNLTCDLVTGNCIDINRALITMLSQTDIKYCYQAGIYIDKKSDNAGDYEIQHGWHCWVSTQCSERIEYWDIAQQLKAGKKQICSGLNPEGGIRFAMSQGMNLKYQVNGQEITVEKFPFPIVVSKESYYIKLPSSSSVRTKNIGE